jgi:hypothetical protein
MTLPISESTNTIQAGPATPAIEDDGTAAAGAALPVVIVSDVETRGQASGEPLRVSFVTDRAVVAGSALPIVMVGNTDLAYDLFTPNADPLVSTDDRTVIGDRWDSLDRVVYGGSAVEETVYGNGVIAEAAVERVPGRIVQWIVRPEDAEAYLAVVLGTTPGSANPVADGYTWLNEFGRLVYGVPGKRVQLHDTHYGTQPKVYLITFLLFDEGAAILRSTIGPEIAAWRTHPIPVPAYPDTRIDYVTTSGNAASLIPYVSARQSPNAGEALRGHQVLGYRVQDVPGWAVVDALATFADRFERANGAVGNAWTDTRGTFGISSGDLVITAQPGAQMAQTYHATPASDGLWLFDFTTGSVVGHWAFTFRHTSATTFLRFSNNGNNNTFVVQSYVAGAFSSTLFSGPISPALTANTRYTVLLITKNNTYLIALNDIMLTGSLQTDASSHNVAGLGIGFGTFDSVANAARVHRVAFYPHSVTLPTAAQSSAMLTGALSSSLLQSFGSVPLTGSGNVVSVQEYSVHAVRVRASIRMPATVGRFTFIGACVAYVDASNWFVVRLAADHDPVLGQADDEVEVVQRIAGVDTVVGKVQIPRQYVDNALFILDSQIEVKRSTSWVHVHLNGDYVESYPLPVELRGATKHGYYRNATDDSGSTVESGAVYA